MTIGCRHGPGCMQPCCMIRGTATSTELSKRQETVGDGVKMDMSSTDAAGRDNISVGSDDSHTGESGSDTPLLAHVERHRFGNNIAIVSCLLNFYIVVRILVW